MAQVLLSTQLKKKKHDQTLDSLSVRLIRQRTKSVFETQRILEIFLIFQ